MALGLGKALLMGVPLLVLSAGCIDDAGVDPDALDTGDVTAPVEKFLFGGSTCWEGGFVAAYKGLGTMADVWEKTDIYNEIGQPMRDGIGTPNPPGQELSGNWHQGIQCDTVTYNGQTYENFRFGYVGQAIKAPVFDVGGADWHFLVSAIGIEDTPAHEDLKLLSKAGFSKPTDVRIDYLAGDHTTPRSAAYVVFATDENGIYESYSTLAKYRDVEPRTIRIWWTVPADGSASPLGSHHADGIPDDMKWNPLYFDIVTEAGKQLTTPPADSVEVGCHAGIDDHGPQGRLCQPTLTNIYEHKSLEFRYGGILKDVVLEKYWHH